MTKQEARETVRIGGMHLGGNVSLRIVPYACSGGFAVVIPVVGQADLWFLLVEYSVNIFEDLGAAAAAPPVVRLPVDAIGKWYA